MDTKISPVLLFGAGVGVTLIVLAMLGVFEKTTEPTLQNAVESMGVMDSDVVKAEAKVVSNHTATQLSGATQVTCTYPRILSASYMDGQVSHELPPEEKEPMIFTFSNLQSEMATLKYIDATRTISETRILRLHEDADKLVFLDGDGTGI